MAAAMSKLSDVYHAHSEDPAGAYPWPTSPPLRPSPVPDTTSPVYPGRPIRPLPRRRIRDRLSAEHAAAIDFPPEAPSSSPIFGYPYVQGETDEQMQRRGVRTVVGHEPSPCADCGHDHSEMESEEEEEDDRHPTMQFSPDSLQIQRRDGEYYGSQTSSADGYESFENMSNKKKRKIPQSGVGGHGHHASLSADMANISLSQRGGPASDAEDATGNSGAASAYAYVHNPPAALSNGLSGPGRGRYGRASRGSIDRRPLAPVSGEPGIISAAIANAAQNMPSTPSAKGQENVSMLQQHASKSPPQKTDFTFMPEGGTNRPVWPGGHAPPPGMESDTRRPRPMHPKSAYRTPPGVPYDAKTSAPHAYNGASQPHASDDQSAPPAPGWGKPPAPGSYPQPAGQPPNSTHGAATVGAAAQPPPPKPRKPRSRARAYEIAARQRKLQKEYQNYQNPPKREDLWICEFCEYESIFGKQPFALIWDYEKKDQAERKRLAERRRLLEKAKMKGRKGKKGSKKNNNAAQNSNNNGAYATQPATTNQQYDDQEEGEYYDDEEYGYDGIDQAPEPLPPLPHSTPGAYPMDPPLENGSYPDDDYRKHPPPRGGGGQCRAEPAAAKAGAVK